jgi:dipeptidyl aminopeptidase/acylaminoacyl peptidase
MLQLLRRFSSTLLAAFFCIPLLFAQEKPAAEGPKPLTPEAALNLRSISDLQLSLDGSRLAFVVTEPPTNDGRPTHIWLYDKSANSARQLTFSPKSESRPRWSPDGKRLAFLSNRTDNQQQIYVLELSGGEGTAITSGKRSIRAFEWSPDGKQIAFLAPDAKTEDEEKKEKDKFDARVVDKDAKHSRLWLVAVPSSESAGQAVKLPAAKAPEPKALTDEKYDISELAWHPTGTGLMVVATDHPESDQNTHRIFFFRLADSSLTQLIAPRGPFGSLRIAPSGKLMAYVGCREDGPTPHDLWTARHGDPAPHNLTGASIDRPVLDYHWLKDDGVLMEIEDGFRERLMAYNPDGSPGPDFPAITLNPTTFTVGAAGEVYFSGQDATHPAELYSWDAKGTPQQLTHLNDSWKQFALVAPERYKYKSFDGLEIEAQLLKPANSDGKSRFPLIAIIHGGPTGSWRDAVEPWGQLLAAKGYAIFYPNIRGSSGYGEKFIESNRGDWGGGDYKDVMAGIHDLVNRGIADPDRIGIGGWSYGGYMSEWAITQHDPFTPPIQFKAAVSGAGLANLVSEYGTEQGPAYDEWFYGLPYEPEKLLGFLNSSPITQLKNAKTPTLILQGEADTTDPVGQSQELYRGLKRYGVDAVLVLYPRENHGFHERNHQIDRLQRLLDWYTSHIKP